MRATRVIVEELRGGIEVENFELKSPLPLVVYSDVLKDRVKVISEEFGCEVLGWNMEDGLGRMFLDLLWKYYKYKDRIELGQSLSGEEEVIFGNLCKYF